MCKHYDTIMARQQLEFDMLIEKHTVGDRTIEVWTQNNTYYAQDILCRGVIGQGDNDAQAIDNLVEALRCFRWLSCLS